MNIFYDQYNFPNPEWICICEGYLYFADTLEGLVIILNTEWKQDKHLAA